MIMKKKSFFLIILNKCLILRCSNNISNFKYSVFLNEIFLHFSFHLFNMNWDIWFLIKLNDMKIFFVFDYVCPNFFIKSVFSLSGISMWSGIHWSFMKNPIFFIILMFFRISRVIPVLWVFLIALMQFDCQEKSKCLDSAFFPCFEKFLKSKLMSFKWQIILRCYWMRFFSNSNFFSLFFHCQNRWCFDMSFDFFNTDTD